LEEDGEEEDKMEDLPPLEAEEQQDQGSRMEV